MRMKGCKWVLQQSSNKHGELPKKHWLCGFSTSRWWAKVWL